MILRILKKVFSSKPNLEKDDSKINIELGTNSKIALHKIIRKEACSVLVGSNSLVQASIVFEKPGASVQVGDRSFIGGSQLICLDNISVGDDVLIAWGCTIVDHDSHSVVFSERRNDVADWIGGRKNWSYVPKARVKISDKVWVGFNSIILKGVILGEGAIVGAGSVVTKDVPDWTIVGGNPARIIKEIPEDQR
jgi:acetyltransferase-like isoleucine patch superfamily enzyme